MDNFDNNGQQGYDPNLYGQPSQGFNDQPNGANQFGGQPNMYGGQPQYNPNMQQPEGEQNGLSIASLVCGILSIVGCCGFGSIFSIAAIVTGVIGRKKGGRKMGTAGMICGIVGLVINILYVILVVFAGILENM